MTDMTAAIERFIDALPDERPQPHTDDDAVLLPTPPVPVLGPDHPLDALKGSENEFSN